MIVIGHQQYAVERRAARHIFVGSGRDFRALCGVRGFLIEETALTLATDFWNLKRDLGRFMLRKDRCAKCAKWVARNRDALVVAERMGGSHG